MSAPRIFIDGRNLLAVCMAKSAKGRVCWHSYGDTIAAAADAGRKHLAEHHTPTVDDLCPSCGAVRGVCGCRRSQTPKPPESGSECRTERSSTHPAMHATHNLSREDC